MNGLLSTEYRRQRSREFWIVRTPVVPKRSTVGLVIETEYFLDAAVAVGRHHQKDSGQQGLGVRNPQDEVVVEFTLLPMIE